MAVVTQRTAVLSRRAVIALASTAVVGATVCPAVAGSECGVACPLKKSYVRVVAIGAHDVTASKPLGLPAALAWAVSQVGLVDLIALDRGIAAADEGEVEFLRMWARDHACHVALVGERRIVVSPEGGVVLDGQERDVAVLSSEIGVIAISSEYDTRIPPAAEIVIRKGGDRGRGVSALDVTTGASVGAYVLDLSARHDRQISGPVIYGPGGEAMTQAAAGWGQSVTASLNMATLRRTKSGNPIGSV
ncbi:MAG: hypothetical protein GKS03_01970 [Alphaproteobacteria bacterium]|nr:hypothetical protein [Alphaproteobacteria bacterium]